VRYLLHDTVDEFAEEIVLAAFTRRDGKVSWLEPWESARPLLENARPAGNLETAEREAQVRWALDLLASDPGWHEPVVARRTEALRDSNDRLRSLVGAGKLCISPYTPPDILGLYVLLPGRAP
jgi:hypothetical protein